MALIAQPPLLALAPGSSASVVVVDTGVAAGLAFTATTNNAAVATVTGAGPTPGPVAFTVSAPAGAFGACSIALGVTGLPNEAAWVPVAVVPQNANVPNGRTSVAAIATVRRRTGLKFGQPLDSEILAALNDGLEQVAGHLDPILATASIPIVSPLTNLVAAPLDVQRIRDVAYVTGGVSQPGTIAYEMVEVPFAELVTASGSTPSGGTTQVGGIPTIYAAVGDAAGALLLQFYPLASSGALLVHYWKRPTLWTLPTPPLVSYTDLDSLWQEAVILYACAQVCEGREDITVGAAYFNRLYDAKIEENELLVKRRARKPGAGSVRDVSDGESVYPVWMR
jgi:hypothetical protein